jgi:hypothetical protein
MHETESVNCILVKRTYLADHVGSEDRKTAEGGRLTSLVKMPRAVGRERHSLEREWKEEANWNCVDLLVCQSISEVAFPGSIDR